MGDPDSRTADGGMHETCNNTIIEGRVSYECEGQDDNTETSENPEGMATESTSRDPNLSRRCDAIRNEGLGLNR